MYEVEFWSSVIWNFFLIFGSSMIIRHASLIQIHFLWHIYVHCFFLLIFMLTMKTEWCRFLGIPSSELQESFNAEAAESIKHPSRYARNLLEYCCFRTLALSIQVTGHLADKKFRRLTYDMMLAWEAPAAASQPVLNVSFSCSIKLLIVQ